MWAVFRRLDHFNITEHPTAAWTAQQVIDAFPHDTAPRGFWRDRDAIYGEAFRQRVAGTPVLPNSAIIGAIASRDVRRSDGQQRRAGFGEGQPDIFEAYCRTHGAVPLPSLLGSLPVLVAKGS